MPLDSKPLRIARHGHRIRDAVRTNRSGDVLILVFACIVVTTLIGGIVDRTSVDRTYGVIEWIGRADGVAIGDDAAHHWADPSQPSSPSPWRILHGADARPSDGVSVAYGITVTRSIDSIGEPIGFVRDRVAVEFKPIRGAAFEPMTWEVDAIAAQLGGWSRAKDPKHTTAVRSLNHPRWFGMRRYANLGTMPPGPRFPTVTITGPRHGRLDIFATMGSIGPYAAVGCMLLLVVRLRLILHGYLQRRKRDRGICPSCGYRCVVDGPCSECGEGTASTLRRVA